MFRRFNMSKTANSELQARIRKEKAQQEEAKRKQQAEREAAAEQALIAFKLEIEDNDELIRRATEYLVETLRLGTTQRAAAEAVGKSAAWVNRLVKWAKADYPACGPFSAESKAKRKRAVQAPEQKPPGIGHNEPPADKPTAPVEPTAPPGWEWTETDDSRAVAAPAKGKPHYVILKGTEENWLHYAPEGLRKGRMVDKGRELIGDASVSIDELKARAVADWAERNAPAPVPAAASGERSIEEVKEASAALAGEEVPPESKPASADDAIIETPRGTFLGISQPLHFIRRVGAAEAEAFAREILAETTPAAANSKPDDDCPLAEKLHYHLNDIWTLCQDQENWLHLDADQKVELRGGMTKLGYLRELLPRLATLKAKLH